MRVVRPPRLLVDLLLRAQDLHREAGPGELQVLLPPAGPMLVHCTLTPAVWGQRCASRITPGCILNHLSTIPACRSSFVGLYGMRLLVGGQRVTAGGLDGRVAGTSPHSTGVGGVGVWGVGY